MQHENFYITMQDGTVKQVNPFTGAEVWSVPGRSNKPITNGVPTTSKKVDLHSPEDYCSFCAARYFETPPEKARMIMQEGKYLSIKHLSAPEYFSSEALFRRTPNLFEIVTLDYWKKNFDYRMNDELLQWRDAYIKNGLGKNHLLNILNYKLKQTGKTDDEIAAIPGDEKLQLADAFFGGGHDLIIAGQHYIRDAEFDYQLFSSGEMTPEEHYHYFTFTIEAMRDIIANNRYVRYISVFQNWLRPAGASFDHLHKQLVALDEWGSSLQHQTKMVREDPNVFNEFGVNFAAHHNLVFAENEFAIAFIGIGHRFPTIEVYSRSVAGNPFDQTPEEVRGVSDLVHSIHAALGSQVSCNEEWYYTPFDSIYKMPWHVLIKLRVNIPAGFEGGTGIYLNPMTPPELRDKIVPRMYKLRDEGKVSGNRVAEECSVVPNPLKYYLR
ncbi:MAG: DUF4921 family protein [Ignavibacteriales bacterium]|nr:DUF4921 family protein [Ignavibacteriales bacterium]